jgi:hypothetical protein
MPCGGIYPIRQLDPEIRPIFEAHDRCWVCNKGGAKHFCDEWDTHIHARCVPKFLQTDEGECVILHGHEVFLDFSLEAEDVPSNEDVAPVLPPSA